jgi:serine/threonine-protein kinase
MNTIINPPVHENRLCPKCGAAGAESDIARNAYRCRQCGYELAHVDWAPNGAVRGVFGWLKSVGDLIGERYKIQTVLGKGGFGATYLVEDQRVKGKRWALKEIPEMLFDEYEVALLSNLDHPSIPIIVDRLTENGMIYLVLKFGGNRTLASETKHKGRIAYADLKGLVIQIGNVLEYLHNRTPPIIHRDLKPENVLLDDADRVMVIDFGIAKESTPATMTRTLGRAASYGFSPPEQLMGTGTDSRSDIYSLAATVYFALTGQTPVAAHERVAGKPLPAPKGIAADLPAEVNDMVLRGLNLNINERPQTVLEFTGVFGAMHPAEADPRMTGKTVQISDLHFGPAISTQLNRSQPLSGAAAAAKAPQRQSWIILSGAVLTATAIAVGGIYWVLNKQDETPPEKQPVAATTTDKATTVGTKPEKAAIGGTTSSGAAPGVPSVVKGQDIGNYPSAIKEPGKDSATKIVEDLREKTGEPETTTPTKVDAKDNKAGDKVKRKAIEEKKKQQNPSTLVGSPKREKGPSSDPGATQKKSAREDANSFWRDTDHWRDTDQEVQKWWKKKATERRSEENSPPPQSPSSNSTDVRTRLRNKWLNR